MNLVAHKRLFCLLVSLALGACSKKPSPGSGAPSARTDAATASPYDASPSVDAKSILPHSTFVTFERLIVPLMAEAESQARSVKICKKLEELRVASLAFRRAIPQGVDAAAWEAASNQMRGAFEGLGGVCMDDPPGFSSDLDIAYESYQRLRKLLAASTAESDDAPSMPRAFLKFEDLMRPLLRQPPSKSRTAKTCEELPRFEEAMLAVTATAPGQVDHAEWDAAVEELKGALTLLKTTCAKKPPTDTTGLRAIDAAYVRLHDLLPQ
jgi:hypothetical protein